MRGMKYNTPTFINGTINPVYDRWRGMHRRCNNPTGFRNEAYKGCTVCEEWNDFDTFTKWHEDNYYEVSSGEKMCLDKDILNKNNREYSPENCIIVPQTINQLFESSKKNRGEYPKGVTKAGNKFIARCSQNGKSVNIGCYNTPEDAFSAYKEFKEGYIKQIADRYKDEIPEKLYNALYDYTVEIED